MKTLNLVDLDKSNIKYKPIKFPDGQQNIIIESFEAIYQIHSDLDLEMVIPIEIKSRLNSFKDLELIICATKSLKKLGVKEIHLYTPYFLGSRSDRQFEEGSCNYLKDVICPIINSLEFESVTVLDPHSHVLEACLNNYKKLDNSELVKWSINKLGYINQDLKDNIQNFVLISPDAGASHKIYKLAEQIGYKGDIITCSKERDESGKLTRCTIPLKAGEHLDKSFIIIDDICDGGATFINIAKELKQIRTQYSKQKIYLIVTHGIFSKGFDELSKYFDGIYCTNSYFNLEDWSANPGDISSSRQIKFVYENVKQLDIFQ